MVLYGGRVEFIVHQCISLFTASAVLHSVSLIITLQFQSRARARCLWFLWRAARARVYSIVVCWNLVCRRVVLCTNFHSSRARLYSAFTLFVGPSPSVAHRHRIERSREIPRCWAAPETSVSSDRALLKVNSHSNSRAFSSGQRWRNRVVAFLLHRKIVESSCLCVGCVTPNYYHLCTIAILVKRWTTRVSRESLSQSVSESTFWLPRSTIE